MVPRTNLEKQLTKIRDKQYTSHDWKSQVALLFDQETIKTEKIVEKLTTVSSSSENNFDFEVLETSKIYHLDQIRKICIDYRLRFLDAKFFKGTIPYEAVTIIKDLEKTHNTSLNGFKIVAPSKLFKLENADDPLLFAPIGNDYFYLIHKWGKDLHPLRKFFMWFFKSFENLLFLTFLVSVLCTFMVPDGLFSKQQNTSTTIMVFLFVFKSIAAVVLFYGFALGKNFNTAIWNSKYFNA
ncbi:hypothetical protein BD809_11350 [Aquimarina intermedia]|uniref:Uncharacterized protein n=2 Tax=Aquimarina intermedia TaxID=350814 RepID=A0A5S5BVP9_9FLAO|nr:hypothetical protein BD809_11350 [Aquimarina intermedia]